MNLIKLAVGAVTLEQLEQFLKRHTIRLGNSDVNIVRTRTRPKQAASILEQKGSLYRVVKGNILCRQQILDFLYVEDDYEQKSCHIVVSTKIIPTVVTPMRPFQGWRYLKNEDAPLDRSEEENSLERELKSLGIIS